MRGRDDEDEGAEGRRGDADTLRTEPMADVGERERRRRGGLAVGRNATRVRDCGRKGGSLKGAGGRGDGGL